MAKKHVVIAAVAGGVALTIAGGVAVAVALHKNDVVLSVDGETHSVSVREDTVKQVLEKDGITVGEHDVVAPSLDTKITNGMEISVLYGRQLQLTIDGESRTVWTTSRTVDDALTQLNLNDPDSKLSTSRSAAIGRGVEGGSALLRTEKADSAPRMTMPGIAWLTNAKTSTSTMIQEDAERTGSGRR